MATSIQSSSTLDVQPCFILDIPAEIRLHIYKFLFLNNGPIDLEVNSSGNICRKKVVNIDPRCLAACRVFYFEGCPVLYGMNMWSISSQNIASLARLRQRSRLCIERLNIRISPMTMRMPEVDSKKDFLEWEKLQKNDNPDLALIGEVLPGVQNLIIEPEKKFSFLNTVLKLTESLPCSPIRDWPRLEVAATFATTDGSDKDHGDRSLRDAVNRTDPNQWRQGLDPAYSERPPQKAKRSLMPQYRALGLGRDMPAFKTIKVRGNLPVGLQPVVESHQCSFGDCLFVEASADGAWTGNKGKSVKKYIWQRQDDDDGRVRDATVDRITSANMHQWVPQLSAEEYKEILMLDGIVEGEAKTAKVKAPKDENLGRWPAGGVRMPIRH